MVPVNNEEKEREQEQEQGFQFDLHHQPGGDEAPKYPPGELWFLGLMFVLTLALFIDSLKLEGIFHGLTNPTSFVQVFLLAMFVLILLEVCRIVIRDKHRESRLKNVIRYLISRDVIVLLAMVIVYAVTLPYLHFTAASVLFLFVTMYLLHRKQPLRKFLIAIGVVAVILLLFFYVMRVVLP